MALLFIAKILLTRDIWWMLLLGIETSCDETSAAVVDEGVVLSNVVSSQIALHAVHGGVVPEIASRQHLILIDEVIIQALRESGHVAEELEAVAVTRGPGLPSALLVGVSTARGLALRLKKPLVSVHHMEAHLYSVPMDPPFVALVVSGGHTMLVHVREFGVHRLLGQTVDDAAGEAFDKAAQLLGLGYPGGPAIELQARSGNPRAWDLPRPMLDSSDWNFSFSGLKTALRRAVTLQGKLSPQAVADLSASFQSAAVEVLVEKTFRAASACGVRQVAVSGGVACNGFLRQQLQSRATASGMRVEIAEARLCTDNAAMIALLAERKFRAGTTVSTEWDIEPDWILA